MSSTGVISLLAQRHSLRRRLQAQRRVIARQLDADSGMHDSYPRSHTMRFLTQQPAQSIRLLVGLASLLMPR